MSATERIIFKVKRQAYCIKRLRGKSGSRDAPRCLSVSPGYVPLSQLRQTRKTHCYLIEDIVLFIVYICVTMETDFVPMDSCRLSYGSTSSSASSTSVIREITASRMSDDDAKKYMTEREAITNEAEAWWQKKMQTMEEMKSYREREEDTKSSREREDCMKQTSQEESSSDSEQYIEYSSDFNNSCQTQYLSETSTVESCDEWTLRSISDSDSIGHFSCSLSVLDLDTSVIEPELAHLEFSPDSIKEGGWVGRSLSYMSEKEENKKQSCEETEVTEFIRAETVSLNSSIVCTETTSLNSLNILNSFNSINSYDIIRAETTSLNSSLIPSEQDNINGHNGSEEEEEEEEEESVTFVQELQSGRESSSPANQTANNCCAQIYSEFKTTLTLEIDQSQAETTPLTTPMHPQPTTPPSSENFDDAVPQEDAQKGEPKAAKKKSLIRRFLKRIRRLFRK